MRTSVDGALLDPTAFRVSAPTSATFNGRADVAFDGQNLLVVWDESATGSSVGSSPRPVLSWEG